MGNIIYHSARRDLEQMAMSNSFTAVVIEVLAIAMSSLAANDAQRALAVQVAGNDQRYQGSGCVGFDVSDLFWTSDGLEQEKAFFIASIDGAIDKLGWESLSYQPNYADVAPMLQKLRALIEAVEPAHIRPPRTGGLMNHPAPDGFPRCGHHGVYLHAEGCVACPS